MRMKTPRARYASHRPHALTAEDLAATQGGVLVSGALLAGVLAAAPQIDEFFAGLAEEMYK